MPQYAKRLQHMEDSAGIIRSLFGSMTDPELISFGGGAPAKEALPVEAVRMIANEVITREDRGIEALQYGKVMGAEDLREIIVDDLIKPKGIEADIDQVLIVNGGLETINLLCQLYIEPGDVVLVESPTFVQAVEIFDMFQARCVEVEMDEDGMVMEDLERKIIEHQPKMVYVIPTFQNPTGITLSQERRRRIAELGSLHDVIILEDDPYRDIRYSGQELQPIKAYDATGHTVMANSFSKIFSPGSRLGYALASKEIIEKLFDIKTATNSHTAMLPQIICAEFFKRGYYPEHLESIRDLYRKRRDVMMESIDKYLPAGTKRVYPDGGLFTWVELPGQIDTSELLKESVERIKVAFVAGSGFFASDEGKGRNCMRVSFGAVPPEKIEEGMKRLGGLIAEKLNKL